MFACAFPLHSEMVKALGKSDLFFRIEMLKKAAIVVVIFAFYRYGITALAWGAAIISVSDYVISAWPNVKLIGYHWRMQALDILSPVILFLLSAAFVTSINWNIFNSPLAVLVSKAALLAVIMGVGTLVFRHTLFADIWEVASSSASKLLRMWAKSANYAS